MSKEKQIEEMARIICGNNRDCRDCGHNSAVRECGCLFYAKRLYEQGYRKQSGWIDVEERLPEKGQGVLAYRGDFRGDMMNTYTYLGSGNWEDDYGYRGSAEHEGITHWMPLPEPPVKKGE